MQRTAILFTLALLAVALFGPTIGVTRAQTPTVSISDSFTRTLQNTWGNADQGGTYLLTGNPDFGVDGSAGTVAISNGIPRTASLSSTLTLNPNSTLRIRADKLPKTGVLVILLFVRRQSSGDMYMGRMRLFPDGSVRLQAARSISGLATYLGSEIKVANLQNRANTFLHLRMLVNGTNPTRIRMRAWADGQAEPTGWNYMVTDLTPSLQRAGSFSVRLKAARRVSNLPILLKLDDLLVTQANPTPTPVPPTPAPTQPPSRSIYWGAYLKGSTYGLSGDPPWNWQVVDRFESHTGKRMSILHFGQPWYHNGYFQPFPTTMMEKVRQRGYIPMLMWGSWDYCCGANQPTFQLAKITNGDFDAYLTQWATAAKAWGHPFFLELDVEMNGWWNYPWSEDLNGNQVGDFVKMWRHVHDLFVQVGATNVTWVWTPNIVQLTSRPLARWYPGEGYVDWLGVDGYNWGTDRNNVWQSFGQVFGYTYSQFLRLAPNKPMMLAQWASSEHGGSKANWISDALTKQLPKNYPQIKAVVWFNWDDGDPTLTWPIESSAGAQGAYAAGIASSYYATNSFANLNTSPIPPP